MSPSPLTAPTYDCFISYRAARFDWVETLARNLVGQGLSVFLDRWGLIPGDDFPGQLSSGDSVLIPQEARSGPGQTSRCGGPDAVGDAERLLPAMHGETAPSYTQG